jgi:hypothetical protein
MKKLLNFSRQFCETKTFKFLAPILWNENFPANFEKRKLRLRVTLHVRQKQSKWNLKFEFLSWRKFRENCDAWNHHPIVSFVCAPDWEMDYY